MNQGEIQDHDMDLYETEDHEQERGEMEDMMIQVRQSIMKKN